MPSFFLGWQERGKGLVSQVDMATAFGRPIEPHPQLQRRYLPDEGWEWGKSTPTLAQLHLAMSILAASGLRLEEATFLAESFAANVLAKCSPQAFCMTTKDVQLWHGPRVSILSPEPEMED